MAPGQRLLYVDWLRGIAGPFMILWHSIDAWTVQTGRESTAFALIAFAAGWAAPLFLFLAGVSIPLAGAARMSRGLNRQAAAWALQKRGWQVFALAHAFRFQSFLLNPNGSWNTLLKPDILNVLGLGVVCAAFCWGRARSWRSAASWLLIPAVIVVVALTPLSREWWWPTLLHPRLEAYVRPVGGYGVFSLFPATGYIFAGAFVGVLVAGRTMAAAALHWRLAIAGGLLLAGGLAVAVLRESRVEGTESPADFVWRTGAMTLALAVSYALLSLRRAGRWSPLVVFGQTSLFVYWVHVELAYGVFSYPIRHSLTLPWSFGAYLALTAFMLGCAMLWRRSWKGPLIPRHMATPLVAASSKPGSRQLDIRRMFVPGSRLDEGR